MILSNFMEFYFVILIINIRIFFTKMIKKFSTGNADILYEILIIYYSHFINPFNQDKEFYNNFIKYSIKKDKELNILKRILNCKDDIETFLYVINKNKDNIFKKYDGLKLGETINDGVTQPEVDEIGNKDESENELDDIIKLIESIIKYSSDNLMLAVNIKNTFWKYLNLIKKRKIIKILTV